jgi:GT2 family glycosyltransferase
MEVPPPFANPRISIVMITRDRCEGALRTVRRLLELPDRARIIVVDNGSSDGTMAAMRELAPRVEAIEAGANLGAAGRNIGVVRATTPYVAFSDDDSWWAPGALDAAADRLDRDPALGLLAAKILVGPEQRLDPMCRFMSRALRRSGHDDMVPIVGFVACGAIVRRSAFLDAGGFERRYGVGGEERLLALDLLREGWKLRYVPSIVAHHHPSPARNLAARRRRETRNDLWSAWLRRPLPSAIAATRNAMRAALHDRAVRRGLADALREARWVLANRMPIPREIERDVRRTERAA